MANEAGSGSDLVAQKSVDDLIDSEIPAKLWSSLTADGGGRVVLVTGAGSSMDWPTNLRSGAEYSEQAHHRLVQDGVLNAGDCSNPRDLSLLADVVYRETGSQLELTARLPVSDWQAPTPNQGHLIAAALLIEGAFRSVVTLNYDLAFQVALAQLGKPANVTIARGPEDHDRIGSQALIYLHRSVESPQEDWVLRRTDLDDSWRENWEEIIASGALSAAVTLFAGLGSPAAVLTETVRRLSSVGRTSYYFADPYPCNEFGTTLSPFLDCVFPFGWTELMSRLSEHVVQRHVKDWEFSARRLAAQEGYNTDELPMVIRILGGLTIIELGKLRSSWLLHEKPYMPAGEGTAQSCLSDVLIAVAGLCSALSADVSVSENGVLTLTTPDQPALSFVCAHGEGVKSWSSVVSRLETRWQGRISCRPRVALVGGISGSDTVPQDLIRGRIPDDLVRGFDQIVPITLDEMRASLRDPSKLWTRLAS